MTRSGVWLPLAVSLIALVAGAAPPTHKPSAPTATPQQITERIAKILRSHTNGAVGFYLKEVGGPVLAALNETRTFEPASTIKVLLLLYAMRQVQSGNAGLNKAIHVYEKPTTGSCPGSATASTETLRDALRLMMRTSDNGRTKAISDTFGIENVNQMSQAIGLSDTHISHTIGCGDQARQNRNAMTLLDAAHLYEGVANATLLGAQSRQTFFSMMSGKEQYLETGLDPAGIWEPNLRLMIEQETPADLVLAQRASFQNQMDLAYKDGRYIFCFDGLCLEYRSVAGWAEIPSCSVSGGSSPRVRFRSVH